MDSPRVNESYYAEVESYFVERRGSPLFISPGEWHLVSRWEELGIPLSVVKEGIDRVFERPKSRLKPRKLGYCRQTVESTFRRFREARLGLREGESESAVSAAVSAQLNEIKDRLQAAEERFGSRSERFARALGEISALVASAIEQDQAGPSPTRLPELEDALTEADRRLIEEAETVVEEPVRAALRKQAASTLEPYRERMPKKVYRSALESAYRRRLRQKLELPVMSLYAR
jgi:transcriptional regulator with XRE-family HTH domain